MRLLTQIILILVTAGCNDVERKEVDGRPTRAASILTAEERRNSKLTPQWLVGYWDHQKDCGTGAGTSLWPDGRYTMADGFGQWSLSGQTLTIIEGRPPSVQFMRTRLGDAGQSEIRIISPKEIFVTWPGSPGTAFYLCDRG